jgi:hypothetical protein
VAAEPKEGERAQPPQPPPPAEAPGEVILKVYDISDLPASPVGATRTDYANLIRQTVFPGTWDAGRGKTVEQRRTFLLVTQTREVHEEVQRYLGMLRKRNAAAAKVGAPVESVLGKVLALKPDNNLVLFSIPKDRPPQPGDWLTVRRGETCLGLVEVVTSYPDMCSAKVLAQVEEFPIRIGDEVTHGPPTVRLSHPTEDAVFSIGDGGAVSRTERSSGKTVWTFESGQGTPLAITLRGETLEVRCEGGMTLEIEARTGKLIQARRAVPQQIGP